MCKNWFEGRLIKMILHHLNIVEKKIWKELYVDIYFKPLEASTFQCFSNKFLALLSVYRHEKDRNECE